MIAQMLALAAALIVGLLTGALLARDSNTRRGYQLGWQDADNWWCGVEEDVEAAKRKLWLEQQQ
jgi:hypothetical protein